MFLPEGHYVQFFGNKYIWVDASFYHKESKFMTINQNQFKNIKCNNFVNWFFYSAVLSLVPYMFQLILMWKNGVLCKNGIFLLNKLFENGSMFLIVISLLCPILGNLYALKQSEKPLKNFIQNLFFVLSLIMIICSAFFYALIIVEHGIERDLTSISIFIYIFTVLTYCVYEFNLRTNL